MWLKIKPTNLELCETDRMNLVVGETVDDPEIGPSIRLAIGVAGRELPEVVLILSAYDVAKLRPVFEDLNALLQEKAAEQAKQPQSKAKEVEALPMFMSPKVGQA